MAIYTSIAFKDGNYDFECDASGTGNDIIEKIVLVNGSEEDNSFTLVISDDWIVCRRERNKLYITVKRNYEEDSRIGYLNVTSTQDNRVEVSLKITQCGDVFDIDTHDTTLLSFNSKCEINEDTKEIIPDEENVTVTVSGGNGKFGVKRIDKYLWYLDDSSSDSSFDSSDDGYVYDTVDYDYGLKVEKNDTGITVISYGKVPTEENFDHYEIVLYHLDKPELTAIINVTYEVDHNEVTFVCESETNSILLPVVSGVETIGVRAFKNNEIVGWSIKEVSPANQDWLKCTATSDALVLEYGEAKIHVPQESDPVPYVDRNYNATITLGSYDTTLVISVARNTAVKIVSQQHIPPNLRDVSYPVGVIVLDEISENVYNETVLENTVSLIVPWDVEEFDIPLLTRFYEDEYTPFPTYDSNILIHNKSLWMNTSLSIKNGDVYSEPIDGEEQVYYGNIQIKVLTVFVKNNYSGMDRTYPIRLRDAQAPANTIYLNITQKCFDPNSLSDSSDDSSID